MASKRIWHITDFGSYSDFGPDQAQLFKKKNNKRVPEAAAFFWWTKLPKLCYLILLNIPISLAVFAGESG